ncbi:MAG: hypothetical protein WC479_08225 [Candidatus Izemoplasmatales bacterium]
MDKPILIKYKDIKIREAGLKIIEFANAVIAEEKSKGRSMTLRGVYYRLVAANIIANKSSEYDRLGQLLNNARLAGLMDWRGIEDKTRNVRGNAHWRNLSHRIQSAAWSHAIDKWFNQPYYIEVWVEKDATSGPIEQAAELMDVQWFSCRGYTSQTEMWEAAVRLANKAKDGRTPLILHFGDHDPSGIDMSRDIQERLEMFMGGVEFVRVALNYDQIQQHHLPENPVKSTDSRSDGYRSKFGQHCWELDALQALDSDYIHDRVVELCTQYRDEEKWDEAMALEESQIKILEHTAKVWPFLVKYQEMDDANLEKGSYIIHDQGENWGVEGYIANFKGEIIVPEEMDIQVTQKPTSFQMVKKFLEDPWMFTHGDTVDSFILSLLDYLPIDKVEKFQAACDEREDAGENGYIFETLKAHPFRYFTSQEFVEGLQKSDEENGSNVYQNLYDEVEMEL